MTPAELTMLLEQDEAFHDPDKAQHSKAKKTVRVEDLLVARRASSK